MMQTLLAAAQEAIARCRSIAECSEEPGHTTRGFLSDAMREVHGRLGGWMRHAGMDVSTDSAGNLRGGYQGTGQMRGRLYVGSHLDTVPRAGAFDGILGVVLGVALIELLERRPGFDIEVVGFSDEEGVRFGVPFIGSRALVGTIDDELLERTDASGISVRAAIRRFGLDPENRQAVGCSADALGYMELHVEQGPVLEDLGYPLAVVDLIAGQSRLTVTFTGQANHAGTTAMRFRRDALTGAAEWITTIERLARGNDGLVATVGRLCAEPGASNVIPGSVTLSLDVRHRLDAARKDAVRVLLQAAEAIGDRRGLSVGWVVDVEQSSVAMDACRTDLLERAMADAGYPAYRMTSGAGHDAMIVAPHMPAVLLFLRSPGAISHHSSENVFVEDVAAALDVAVRFVQKLEGRDG